MLSVPLALVATREQPSGSAAPAPGRAISPLVPAGFAVAGAGLLAGAITGGLTLAKASSLEVACTGGVCPHTQHDALGSANTLANLSNVSLGIGAAGVIVGVVGLVLTFRAPEPARAGRLVPLVGPGSIGVAGAF